MYLLPNGQPVPLRDEDAEPVSKWRAERGDWIRLEMA